MRNITDDIYQAILSLNGTQDQNIFKYIVPENYHNITDAPIVRIFPLPGNPDEYYDNTEVSREYNVQIDVWDSQQEPFMFMEDIVTALKQLNFQVTYRQPMYDLDTKTFRELIRVTGIITL